MNIAHRIWPGVLGMGLVTCLIVPRSASAQGPTASGNQPVQIPPPLPMAAAATRSPVDVFRTLLAASPAEREKLLARRPDDQQAFLRAQVREYEALPPEERESRLRSLEIRAYLTPLLKLPGSNRVARIATVPELDRALIEAKLRWWDQLSTNAQRHILESENALRLICSVRPSAPRPALSVIPKPIPMLNSNQLSSLEKDIARWKGLSPDMREQVASRVQDAIEKDEAPVMKEVEKSLTPEARRQAEHTLSLLRQLPKAERVLYLNGFNKFAELTPAERQAFLRNADTWQHMSAQDRENWRAIVTLVPPMPPGLFDANQALPYRESRGGKYLWVGTATNGNK